MDLSEYVSKKQEAAIGNSLRKNAGGVTLCSKKKMLLTSLFTGRWAATDFFWDITNAAF